MISPRRGVSALAGKQQRAKLYQLFFRNPKGLMGFILLVSIVFLAFSASFVAPFDPTAMHVKDRFSAPGRTYLLGTDFYGRDVLSRILYAFRVSLSIAFTAVIFAVVLGSTLGILAGYLKRLEAWIMRWMDVMFAFPVLLLAITIVVILGAGSLSAILAIGIVYTPIFARVARGPTLVIKEENFVEAACAMGAGSARIILKHILPNVAVPIFVQATVELATAILFESALSFLGLGSKPPDASLGLMISQGKDFLEISPWATIFPGMAIALIVLSFNLLGDAMQEVLDPRLRQREG